WLPGVAANHLDVSFMSGMMVALLAITWDAFRFALYCYFVATVQSRRPGSILVWPLVWVAREWLWADLFPWRIWLSQLGCLALCKFAEFIGGYGVSFLFMWGSAVVAHLLKLLWQPTTSWKPRWLWMHAIVCGLVLTASFGWGMWRINQIEADAAR